MRRYRPLTILEKAHQLTLALYETSENFPDGNAHTLTSQIRYEAVALSANIVEGCGGETGEALMASFLSALSASNKLEYLLLLARDLGYLSAAAHRAFVGELGEIRNLLARFIQSEHFFANYYG
jgi:four helix bundle protein